MALSALLMAGGAAVFGVGGSVAVYTTGYALMSFSGSGVMASSTHLAKVMPTHAGLILTSVATLFGASVVVFQFMELLNDALGLTVRVGARCSSLSSSYPLPRSLWRSWWSLFALLRPSSLLPLFLSPC
jgi:hypothetical protein